MVRVGAIVRLLMLVACLVPFTSPRQASAAFAPSSAALPAPVESERPQEETDTQRLEEEVAVKAGVRAVQPRTDSPPGSLTFAFPNLAPFSRLSAVSTPVRVDPFRNGLGSPYRC